MKTKKNKSKRKQLYSGLLLLGIFVLALGLDITSASAATESKTFYFRNQPVLLANSHLLSESPPASANSQVTSITSVSSPGFRHFHPGLTGLQETTSAEPAHSPPVDSASWVSSTPLNGTFQAGSWRFVVHKTDNIGGEFSKPHFNVYSSPSNTDLANAVFLFHVEGPDWWNNQDEQLSFVTASVGPFEFNGAYLVVQLFDHCIADCNGGKTVLVFEDGLTAASQTRIEPPLFAPPPVPDTTPPAITILGLNPAEVVQNTAYADAGAEALDDIDGDLTANIVTTNAVSTAVAGTYAVTYTVSDSSGNTATATRTVNVVADTLAPVITVLGNNPVIAALDSVYTDAGATAADNVDGDITAAIATTGLPVDTGTLGAKMVTYTVTDRSGNTASETRTVNVVDRTVPVIAILGDNPVTISVGAVYADAGATALDNVDGDLTAGIVTTNSVNTAAVGAYIVTYTVTDAAGNTATTTRTVNVIDTTPPVITILGSNPASVSASSVYTDAGATATDNVDPAVTVNAASNVNTNIIGTYTVTYTATDAAGNAATASRTVNVIDTNAPVITILGDNPATVVVNTVYADSGASAADNVDGDVTARIIISGSVNTAVAGVYTVTYAVTDSAGNTATASRTVNVIPEPDTTPPLITILGNNPETISQGSVYVDTGAAAADNVDGNITASISAASTVNTAVAGTYTVTYSVTDSSGNTATASRTVNVADTTAPVIIMSGVSPVNVIIGTVYTDAGAVATDNFDAVVTVNVNSTVDTSAIGTYTITYTATDAAGNTAIPVVRTVNVVAVPPVPDTTPPAITILGLNPAEVVQNTAYADAGAEALDDIDGDLTANIVTTNAVSTAVAGTYAVTYTVSDSSGNTATATRTVNVVAQPAPSSVSRSFSTSTPHACSDLTVTLAVNVTGTDTFYVIDELLPPGWTVVNPGTGNTLHAGHIKWAAISGAASTTYQYSIAVPCSASGPFQFSGEYGFNDLVLHQIAGQDSVNVAVTPQPDNDAPVITVVGKNPEDVLAGSVYTDAGATVIDEVDGPVPVTTTGAVNTAIAGTYTLTYTATDSSGNTATATRTVTVSPRLSSVSVTPASLSLVVGETAQLAALPLDQDGAAFVGATVLWNSSNTAVATVNATGFVTAVIPGASTITATATSGALSVLGTSTINVITPPAPAASSSGSGSGGGGSSSGGGGGSSSGGAGGGSTPNSESSLLQAMPSTGDGGKFSFQKFSAIAVYRIEAKLAGASINPLITVSEAKLDSTVTPPSVAATGKGRVYKYLSIVKSDIGEISEATVSFAVSAAWLSENSIDPATVKLNRLVAGQWNTLPTKMIGSDGQYYMYDAVTPGFSIFAISGEPKQAAVKPAQAAQNPEAQAPKPAEQQAESTSQPQAGSFGAITGQAVAADKKQPNKGVGAAIIAAAVVSAIAIVIGWRFRRAREQRKRTMFLSSGRILRLA